MSEAAQRQHRHPAYRGTESFVFVSYSHDDELLVNDEIAALASQGVRVTYDEGIHPGHSWREDIARSIETCAVFLLFITRSSLASSNCRNELSLALHRERPILPVFLEDVELPSAVRLQIGDRHAIIRSRFTPSEFRQRLAAAVISYVGKADDPSRATPHIERATQPPTTRTRRLVFGVCVAISLLAAYVGFQGWRASSESQRQRAEALAQASKLVGLDQYGAAFSLIRPLVESSRDEIDSDLNALWKRIVVPITPIVANEGATVYFKPYDDSEGEWIKAGTAPFASPSDAPRGALRLKIEKAGFRDGYFVAANPGPLLQTPDELSRLHQDLFAEPPALELVPDGGLANDMVLVPRTNVPVYLAGWTPSFIGDHQYDIPAFAIGRAEVSNREFKEFVDVGGYENMSYWEELKFVDGGDELTPKDAVARFVDQTGHPGPAGWQLGTFATGSADLPVVGISWYEAVAYARFRGLSLPTVHHWLRAAFGPMEGAYPTAPAVANASHFKARSPLAANAGRGLGPWGAVNTAGNAREWVWNFVGDRALALGGAWDEFPAMYTAAETISPMDRCQDCGIRLMRTMTDAPVAAQLLEPIELTLETYITKREPVSDDAFNAMRFQFTAMHRTPHSVKVERISETDAWVADEVVLTFADDDTFTLYILRGHKNRNKLQPIIVGPPSDAPDLVQPNRNILQTLFRYDFLVNRDRVLVWPMWAGSYERYVPNPVDPDALAEHLRTVPVTWYHDLVTALDYLATRDDIDDRNIGFVGISYGSMFAAAPLFAIEGRLKAGVLISAGLYNALPLHPMFDAINYLPHVTAPILMLNGRYDTLLPYETSQKRFFDLLGTNANDKRIETYDNLHIIELNNELKREASAWFDRYLGPANSKSADSQTAQTSP